MQVTSMHFKARAGQKLADQRLQASLRKLSTKWVAGRATAIMEIAGSGARQGAQGAVPKIGSVITNHRGRDRHRDRYRNRRSASLKSNPTPAATPKPAATPFLDVLACIAVMAITAGLCRKSR